MARPTRINAGDDATWTESAGSASAVVYYFLDALGEREFSVTATVSSGTASFDLAAATTAAVVPGKLTAWRRTTDDGDVATTNDGELVLAPNPDGSSPKTHNQQAVILLEAHLEGRLPQGLESHTIDGQSIAKIGLAEAQTLLRRYREQMTAEQDQFKGNAGGSNLVKYRFTSP